jgi:hypothetical protein
VRRRGQERRAIGDIGEEGGIERGLMERNILNFKDFCYIAKAVGYDRAECIFNSTEIIKLDFIIQEKQLN